MGLTLEKQLRKKIKNKIGMERRWDQIVEKTKVLEGPCRKKRSEGVQYTARMEWKN